jgi:hypothetical protein
MEDFFHSLCPPRGDNALFMVFLICHFLTLEPGAENGNPPPPHT